MTDLEQQLTDHLRRRAAAATPRYDLEAIEQGMSLVSLVDLDDHRRRRPLIRAIVGVAAAVTLLAALAMVADTPDRDDSPPVTQPDDVPAEQMTTIRAMVDAVNARDTDALIGLFAPSAVFTPRATFWDTSFPYNSVMPVAEDDFDYFRAALAIVDAWGLEAELVACGSRPVRVPTIADGVEAVVECEVATRWHTLSMEIIDVWSFELRGAELLYWGSFSGYIHGDLALIDLDPTDRTLPLGYDGLEAWEAWLQANHPDEAARFLNPRGERDSAQCDDECVEGLYGGDADRAARLHPLVSLATDEWTINGHPFAPIGLVPYDPALADEIEASIQQYLEDDGSRSPWTVALPAAALVAGIVSFVAWRRQRSPTPPPAHTNAED